MKNKYFLEFSSQLLKEEKNILKLFIEKFLEKETMEFKLDELEIPKLRNCKKNYIERLGKKGISFIDGNVERVYCPFFSSLSFNNDLLKVYFNEKFIEYLVNKEKKIKYSLKEVLYLKNSFSIDFFYKVLKENKLKNNFSIELEKFKEIVTIESYSRIYDLKRFVLTPLVDDINKNTDFKIEFICNKENGVWKIDFLIKNDKIDLIKNYTKLFLKLYKNHIIDKKKVALLIFNAINLHGYDYIKSKILFAIKNKKKYNLNFDNLLENVLCDRIGEFYILLRSFEVIAENIDIFRKTIHREIHPLDFPEINTLEYNTNLAKQLYSLKPKEILTLTSENLKLELFFNPKEASKIDIYKKYTK